MPRITSRRHPIVERCRALARRRQDDDPVLLDGAHLIEDAIAAGVSIEVVITAGSAHAELAARARRAGADIHEATADVLDAASPVRTSTGIVALARWTPQPLSSLVGVSAGVILGLVDVQDPGNVGSVIRSADGLGAAGVIAMGDTADPGGWKALRGAMGGTFRMPVARATVDDAVAAARGQGLALAATVATGGTPLDRAAIAGRVLVLLGHEGAGLPPAVVAGSDARWTVPMRSATNSLNVAATAALVLWEARRQQERPS